MPDDGSLAASIFSVHDAPLFPGGPGGSSPYVVAATSRSIAVVCGVQIK